MAMRLSLEEDTVEETHEINVTPFIDVILVLLIIFMVAAPLSTVDVNVDLPASTAQPAPRPDKPLFLTVKADLSLVLGEAPVQRAEFGSALDAAAQGDKEQRVFVRADRAVSYGDDHGTDESLAGRRLFEDRARRHGGWTRGGRPQSRNGTEHPSAAERNHFGDEAVTVAKRRFCPRMTSHLCGAGCSLPCAVVLVHAAIVFWLLYIRELQSAGAPPAAIMIELAPLDVAPPTRVAPRSHARTANDRGGARGGRSSRRSRFRSCLPFPSQTSS